MIKANELRIGNKVIWKGIEIFVLNIFEDGINIDLVNPQSKGHSFVDFEGIPLTSELLEQCGFVEIRKNVWLKDRLQRVGH
jgi:hypothetical protein